MNTMTTRNTTSIKSRLFKILLSPYLRRLITKAWRNGDKESIFPAEEINPIFKRSWQYYFASISDLEKQANLGNWLVMNFAHLTLGAYKALIDHGVDENDAVHLIYKLTWGLTETWTRRVKRISRILLRDPMHELSYFVNLVMKTFFSPPAYQFESGKLETGGFFLDVKRCPVAKMMADSDASDLCVQTWCGVDFGLVEMIGGKLQRHGTLAMGKQKCDFVFQPEYQD